MSTDLDELTITRPVRTSLPNDAGIGAFRPVMPKRGLPRLMRRLVGVDEGILDWVPEERPRYTRLGFIVLNTGLLAGVSMHMAITTVTNAAWWLLVPADLMWALIIITVDSWLISSTHGTERAARLGVYVPRLVVSVLLGLVIAEPLVLGVFHQSIDNEISEYRKSEVDGYESALKRCNPPSGTPLPDPSCDGLRITIAQSPQSIQGELDQAIKNRDTLKQRTDAADAQLEQLEQLARDECAGRAGPGLTGVVGEGGECRRNRDKADQFRQDSQIDQLHRQLATAETEVAGLTTKLSDAEASAERQVNDGITTKVKEKRENLVARGLLDEFDALGRLSSNSFVIATAHLLLALLLIVLDCLPVLTKLMSSRTAYDEQLRSQLEVDKRLHERQLRANERRDSVDLEIQERRLDQKLRTNIEVIRGEDRSAKERRRIELDSQIDRLAAALERER
ncbi:DUF4407 domain-containing protein [Actinophytocola sp.]|uniref:DUF4407 domain-containing protein n=1 Tax=Actinophytocola sp. TaxID=1872138 RepID=UPI002ED3DA4D